MALITCKECGKQISDLAEVCVHCGFPIRKFDMEAKLIDETTYTNENSTFDSDRFYDALYERAKITIKQLSGVESFLMHQIPLFWTTAIVYSLESKLSFRTDNFERWLHNMQKSLYPGMDVSLVNATSYSRSAYSNAWALIKSEKWVIGDEDRSYFLSMIMSALNNSGSHIVKNWGENHSIAAYSAVSKLMEKIVIDGFDEKDVAENNVRILLEDIVFLVGEKGFLSLLKKNDSVGTELGNSNEKQLEKNATHNKLHKILVGLIIAIIIIGAIIACFGELGGTNPDEKYAGEYYYEAYFATNENGDEVTAPSGLDLDDYSYVELDDDYYFEVCINNRYAVGTWYIDEENSQIIRFDVTEDSDEIVSLLLEGGALIDDDYVEIFLNFPYEDRYIIFAFR